MAQGGNGSGTAASTSQLLGSMDSQQLINALSAQTAQSQPGDAALGGLSIGSLGLQLPADLQFGQLSGGQMLSNLNVPSSGSQNALGAGGVQAQLQSALAEMGSNQNLGSLLQVGATSWCCDVHCAL